MSEEQDDISWRGVYWKLGGIALFASVALLVLGLWLYKPVYCGWSFCSLRWAGDAPTVPFGSMNYHFAPSADLLLWGVLGIVFAVWLVRRILRLGKFG